MTLGHPQKANPSRITRAAFKPQHGFTLVELILVLFFIGLIMGMATPLVMSTLDRIELRASAREMASALRYARSEAVSHKTSVIFEGYIDRNQYRVSHDRTEHATQTALLDEKIRIVHYTNELETIQDETFKIKFFPQGNSTGGTIRLEAGEPGESENLYAISIDPVTGKIRIDQEER